MYNHQSKKTAVAWGEWLNTFLWDYFSTITYRVDIKPVRNMKIIEGLVEFLRKRKNHFLLFWVMEFTHAGNTHNHFLVQGEGLDELINEYFLSKGLVDKRFVSHEGYNKSKGASFYVVKYITSKKTEYDLIQHGDTKMV